MRLERFCLEAEIEDDFFNLFNDSGQYQNDIETRIQLLTDYYLSRVQEYIDFQIGNYITQ